MTLPKRLLRPDCGKVYCIDVYDEVLNAMPDYIKSNCEFRTHIFESMSHDKAMESAENLLNEYRENASLVVTSRMHCAVPCLAMGIPIIFVNRTYSYRFSLVGRDSGYLYAGQNMMHRLVAKGNDCEKAKALRTVQLKRLKKPASQ